MDDSQDRQAILARRAIFLTTTLAALSCSPGTNDATVPTATDTVAVTASATTSASTPPASSSAAVPVGPSKEERQADWKERVKLAPPLSIAASLQGEEKTEITETRDRFQPIYDRLEALWVSAPMSCAPRDKACSGQWEEAAKSIEEMRASLRTGPCSNPRGLAKLQRTQAHFTFLHGLLTTLDGQLSDAARAQGDAKTWAELTQKSVIPMPCLRCAPPQPRGVFEERMNPLEILFKDGASDLGPDMTPLLEQIKVQLNSDKKLVYVVRGHADPEEKGDKAATAKARAQAVIDWLVKAGIAKARLKLSAYGADLPIDTSATELGRTANRRVDFEKSN